MVASLAWVAARIWAMAWKCFLVMMSLLGLDKYEGSDSDAITFEAGYVAGFKLGLLAVLEEDGGVFGVAIFSLGDKA